MYSNQLIQHPSITTQKELKQKPSHLREPDFECLSSKGWAHFHNLEKSTSKTAFMAMVFTKENEWFYKNICKPATELCGYDLQIVAEIPQGGCIVADMELKIKRAPFIIADISNGNNEAYLEAGYAEGMGKLVIYTCDEETWDSSHNTIKPHFDITTRSR